MRRHASAHAHGGLRLTSGVFCDCLPSYIFSCLRSELADSFSLSSHVALGESSLLPAPPPPFHAGILPNIYMDGRDPNSGSLHSVAQALLTEPSSQVPGSWGSSPPLFFSGKTGSLCYTALDAASGRKLAADLGESMSLKCLGTLKSPHSRVLWDINIKCGFLSLCPWFMKAGLGLPCL